MILIEDILVSDDLIKKQFACQLSACKGACCYEGDYGAPLDQDELAQIEEILDIVLPYLDKSAVDKIKSEGFFRQTESKDAHETNLMSDASCVFMGRNDLGITFCGLEKAYNDGKTNFKKPISCHLYPVRVTANKQIGFEALNYDVWDICQAACSNGARQGIYIYQFVKDALIRKYGEAFYEALEAAARDLEDT
ncbi:MAG: DUF3109 family protein [Saprospiraceae bacterium]|nr:DUF3109 family protein [Saprospiraceae bacterium]